MTGGFAPPNLAKAAIVLAAWCERPCDFGRGDDPRLCRLVYVKAGGHTQAHGLHVYFDACRDQVQSAPCTLLLTRLKLAGSQVCGALRLPPFASLFKLVGVEEGRAWHCCTLLFSSARALFSVRSRCEKKQKMKMLPQEQGGRGLAATTVGTPSSDGRSRTFKNEGE